MEPAIASHRLALPLLLVGLAALAGHTDAMADAVLRIACDGADARAEITINGVFKGECPLDIAVPPGAIKLKVAKKVDATRERVFEDEFRIGDGVAKRVEVVLPQTPRLNEQAQRQAEALTVQLIKDAQAGNANAMSRLGDRYYFGNGIAKDEEKAAFWFRKAAEAGEVSGMANLAFMLANGRSGLKQSDAEALEWFRKAADLGSGYSMHALGVRHANGSGGVARDDAAAADWYRKAAEKGYVDSMVNLGFLYHTGRGVTKDTAEAVRWYRLAAEKGNHQGMHNLAAMLAGGQGTEKDEAQAVTWYRKAADLGNAHSIAELKKRGLR